MPEATRPYTELAQGEHPEGGGAERSAQRDPAGSGTVRRRAAVRLGGRGAASPSTSRPHASGVRRTKIQARGARPSRRPTPIPAHAVRQPRPNRRAHYGNAIMKPMLITTA